MQQLPTAVMMLIALIPRVPSTADSKVGFEYAVYRDIAEEMHRSDPSIEIEVIQGDTHLYLQGKTVADRTVIMQIRTEVERVWAEWQAKEDADAHRLFQRYDFTKTDLDRAREAGRVANDTADKTSQTWTPPESFDAYTERTQQAELARLQEFTIQKEAEQAEKERRELDDFILQAAIRESTVLEDRRRAELQARAEQEAEAAVFDQDGVVYVLEEEQEYADMDTVDDGPE